MVVTKSRKCSGFVIYSYLKDSAVTAVTGSKGWRSGENARQCGLRSNPDIDAICGLSLLLVLSFAPRGFSPANPVFPSPQKPTFPNSNSTGNQVDKEPLCGCATSKSLFIIYLKEMHTGS